MPPAGSRRKDLEDPENTWNAQFMLACLAGNVAECQALMAKGADPVRTREPTPFSSGLRLSPLAAVLLQGSFTQGTREVIRLLMERGASVNDAVPLPSLPTLAHPAATGSEAVTPSQPQQQQQQQPSPRSGGGGGTGVRSPSRAAGATGSAGEVSGGGAAAASAVPRGYMEDGVVSGRGAGGAAISAASSDAGTVLHYCVALGDHAHLLQLLMVLAPDLRAGPPRSLLPDVAREMALPPPPPPAPTAAGGAAAGDGSGKEAGSRTGSGRRSRAASMSRRLSRQPGTDRRAQPQAAADAEESAGARVGPASPLPTLDRFPYELPQQQQQEQQQEQQQMTVNGGGGGEAAALSTTAPVPQPDHTQPVLRLLPCQPPGATATTTPVINLAARTERGGLTALEVAVRLRDTLATRLLTYYGAPGLALHPTPLQAPPVTPGERAMSADAEPVAAGEGCANTYVNSMQTALARACAAGDVATMEALLDAGESLTQLSADGRYTLMHYAAGQPTALQYLVQRGLSGDVENAAGESALVSVLRHGTGRNADHACRETPCMTDAAKLAALPMCVVRNYILAPLPPLVVPTGKGGGGQGAARGSVMGRSASKSLPGAAGSTGNGGGVPTPPDAAAAARNVVGGGGEVGTWFAFTRLPSAELIHNLLLYAGASINGHIPDDELDLAYVRFAEGSERVPGAALTPPSITAAAMGSGGSLLSTGVAGGGGGGADVTGAGDARRRGGARAAPGVVSTGGAGRSPSPGKGLARGAGGSPRRGSAMSVSVSGGAAAAMWASAPTTVTPPVFVTSATGPVAAHSTAAQLPGRLPLRATPLMHCVMNHHPELIRKFVVEYRADVMGRDSRGACVLHYAAQSREPSVLDFFLSPLVLSLPAATVNHSNAIAATTAGGAGAGGAVGFVATSSGSSGSTVGALLDVNLRDMSGRTPLHYAAAAGNAPAVRRLLAMGTALHAGAPDAMGYTALHCACLANSLACVEALVRHSDTVVSAICGASSSVRRSGGPPASAGASQGAPLASSRSRRRSAAGAAVYDGGSPSGFGAGSEYMVVDVESEDVLDHATALEMCLARNVDPRIARVLLSEGGASFLRPSGLPNGGGLLHRAVADDNVAYVRLLLEHYADPNAVDGNDDTPLLLALDRPADAVCVEVVETLLRFGALPNAQSGATLRTPLHVAAARGHHHEVLRLLFFELPPESLGRAARPQRRTAATVSSEPPFRRDGERGEEEGEMDGDTDPSRARGARGRGCARGGGRVTAPGRRLIPEPHLLLTDASGRTPFQLLCGHDEPAAQAAALPVLRAILSDTGMEDGASPEENEGSDHSSRTGSLSCSGASKLSSVTSPPHRYNVTASITAGADARGGGGSGLEPSPFLRRLVRTADVHGRLPLHDACRSLFADCVEMLLGVDPTTLLHTIASSGGTALHEVMTAGGEGGGRGGLAMTFAPAESQTESKTDTEAVAAQARRVQEREQRVSRTLAALASAAQHCLPGRLSGFATGLSHPSSSAMTCGTIRDALRGARPGYGGGVGKGGLGMSLSSSPSPSAVSMVSSWHAYLQLADADGRTALLLAGERGDVVASRALVRLLRQPVAS